MTTINQALCFLADLSDRAIASPNWQATNGTVVIRLHSQQFSLDSCPHPHCDHEIDQTTWQASLGPLSVLISELDLHYARAGHSITPHQIPKNTQTILINIVTTATVVK